MHRAHVLLGALVLAACAAEPPVQALPPIAAPASAHSSMLTFPGAAEIAAGQEIRIRPGATLGRFGPIQQMPGAPSCGILEEGRVSGRPLAVSSPAGAVTPGFHLSGRCTRPTADRGLTFVMMDRAVLLPSGLYLTSATRHCFLPNVGDGVCIPK